MSKNSQEKNEVIVVAHQKGGVGKTTIASNIAVELAKNYNLTAIDLDLQKSLTYFNNVRRKAKMDALNLVEVNSADELKEIINNNKGILLIDVGGFDSDINRLAITGADQLITPVSDSGIEVLGLIAFRQILAKLREKRKDLQAKILFNKIHTRAGENNKSLTDILSFIDRHEEFTKFSTMLRDRNDYKRAWENGQSVIEYNNKAVIEMNNLIEEVKNG